MKKRKKTLQEKIVVSGKNPDQQDKYAFETLSSHQQKKWRKK